MTPSQRRQLIEKRQQGTLTDEENEQYQELLQTDPSFYNEAKMNSLLMDVFRQDADQKLWEAVSKARKEARTVTTPYTLLASVWRYRYAMAACIVLLLAGVWLYSTLVREDLVPMLVKSEKRDVRLLADSARVGYDDYAGSVWIRWKQNSKQNEPQTYTFCHDTLTVFLRNAGDTLKWEDVGLRFSSEQQILYLKQTNKPLLPLLECTDKPQSLVFLP